MAYENVLIEKKPPVGVLTVNRPDQLNALNSQTLMEIYGAVGELSSADDIRVLVITGAGEKAFVASADIKEMVNLTVTQARAFSELGHRVCTAIEEIQQPVIAAVNGFSLGGGNELALACDIIYASDKAKFGQPEVNLAVVPGFGGTQRLVRRVGVAKGGELLFTGDMVSAQEAKEMKMINEVYPAGELMDKVMERAKLISTKGPLALAQMKRLIYQGSELPLGGALELECQVFASLFGTNDQRNGMQAFMEKRKVEYKGN